jgi:hypothetical protein
MKTSEIINLSISILLILTIGLFTGYGMGYFQGKRMAFPAIQAVNDINPGIATIKLLEYQNGTINGVVEGKSARIAYSPSNIETLESGETFKIPVYNIKLGSFYDARKLPENTQFIASKNGKYYYSVLDKRSFGITPKNRITFQTEEMAEKSGFLKAK